MFGWLSWLDASAFSQVLTHCLKFAEYGSTSTAVDVRLYSGYSLTRLTLTQLVTCTIRQVVVPNRL